MWIDFGDLLILETRVKAAMESHRLRKGYVDHRSTHHVRKEKFLQESGENPARASAIGLAALPQLPQLVQATSPPTFAIGSKQWQLLTASNKLMEKNES